MPVRKDESGRRWVAVEVEVPGTPEEVWRAIATGPGISSWFVPTEVVEDEAGTPTKMVLHFGPGMDSNATVTKWDPPRSFSAESNDWGEGSPPVATEWSVEARDGGTCLVRVVHSLFASTDDWDNQIEHTETGWPGFFRILRLYLTHFAGLPCTPLQAMGISEEPASRAWAITTSALGLTDASVGEALQGPASAPPLAGTIELKHDGEQAGELLLRLDQPTDGIAHLSAMEMGGKAYVTVRMYLYGEQARDAAARDEARWTEWMESNVAGGV